MKLESAFYSLYVHFPFCRSKCRYCDFYSLGGHEKYIENYIISLANQLSFFIEKYKLSDKKVSTLYCGGGTPSILSVNQWELFSSKVLSMLDLSKCSEFSIEVNPESFSDDKAKAWLKSGVNRVTLGVQSLDNKELDILGRAHNSAAVIETLSKPSLEIFNSIGVDVMYGLPNQTAGSFKLTLDKLLSYEVIKHISAYELTIHEGTDFFRQKDSLNLPSDNEVSDIEKVLVTTLDETGFKRYEVSNYAKEGYESKHNRMYWSHKPYIGIGTSAYSFFNGCRFSVVAKISDFLTNASSGAVDYMETLTQEDLAQEVIFLSLRRLEGLSASEFKRISGKKFLTDERTEEVEKLISTGFLEESNGHYRATDKGYRYIDSIVRRLI